jgi:peptide-methionine (S)-S-oxide reductase
MSRIVFVVMALTFQVNAFAENKTAIFAGGCFWCMEKPYDEIDGVISSISGYTGGHTENPTYESTSTGTTGHYEAIAITYDPGKVSYQKLLDIFWKNIDPFDSKGQFCDKGPQYRAAIFTNDETEVALAKKSKSDLQQKLNGKEAIVTEILPAKQFFDAEEYHQDYYKKNPVRYRYYRFGCGRDKRLDEVQQLINSN